MKNIIFFVGFGIVLNCNIFFQEISANSDAGSRIGSQQQPSQGQGQGTTGQLGPFWAARGRRSGFVVDNDFLANSAEENDNGLSSKIKLLSRGMNPDPSDELMPGGESPGRRLFPQHPLPSSQRVNAIDDVGLYYTLLALNKRNGNSNSQQQPPQPDFSTFWAARG